MSAASDAASWLYDFVLQVLQAPTWSVPVMEFIDSNCGIFDSGDENKLVYSDIHERFCRLIETLLESHLADIGLTSEDFAAVCAAAPRGSGLGKIVFEQLMSATDFLTFKALMRKRNSELELQAIRELQQKSSSAKQSNQYDNKEPPSDDDEDEKELNAAIELSRKMMVLDAEAAVSNVRTAQAEAIALEEAEARALQAFEEAQLAAAIAASIASDETWHEAERLREVEELMNEKAATAESIGFAEDIEIEQEKKRRKEAEIAAKAAIAAQTESDAKSNKNSRPKQISKKEISQASEPSKLSYSKLPSLFGPAQPALELSGLDDVLKSSTLSENEFQRPIRERGGGGGGGGGGEYIYTDSVDIKLRSTSSSDPAEAKNRQKHLRDLRDSIKEKHQEERKRALEEAESTSGHAFADSGVRVTLQAALAQVKSAESTTILSSSTSSTPSFSQTSSLSVEEEKALQARRSMAARLKQEGGIKK
jgi:hypothetical protein